jgi:hypothetical protein
MIHGLRWLFLTAEAQRPQRKDFDHGGHEDHGGKEFKPSITNVANDIELNELREARDE